MNVYLAEFPGIVILTLFGGGVCANVNSKRSAVNGVDWTVITARWGLAVTMGVFTVGQFSGTHLNPTVFLAFALDGGFDQSLVLGYIVAQTLGAIVGATVVWSMYLPHWKATEEAGAKLGVFSITPAIRNYFANFLSEIIGTMALTLGILLIGVNKIADGLDSLVVGVLIVAIGLSLGGVTSYVINPTRDLDPRIARAILLIAGKGGLNWSYAIVPILEPTIGGLLGVMVYTVLYKRTFNIGCAIAIVVVIIILTLGYILGRSSEKGDIEPIY